MRFALINNEREEAKPGLKGNCSGCSREVVAKCGNQRIHHWAHKGNNSCDSWWEPETEWHRSWKNNYPTEWQEVFLPDSKTGEKHIADVCTIHGLVIEFQHSHIQPLERLARENFYKNMVWVVDGTRLKLDYPRFLKEWNGDGISDIFECDQPNIFKVSFPEFCFPKAWLNSTVPVIFDFFGDGSLEDTDGKRSTLYCLFPQVSRRARVAEISRTSFIKSVTNGEWINKVTDFINDYKMQDNIQFEQEQKERYHSRGRSSYPFGNGLLRLKKFTRRRRF